MDIRNCSFEGNEVSKNGDVSNAIVRTAAWPFLWSSICIKDTYFQALSGSSSLTPKYAIAGFGCPLVARIKNCTFAGHTGTGYASVVIQNYGGSSTCPAVVTVRESLFEKSETSLDAGAILVAGYVAAHIEQYVLF